MMRPCSVMLCFVLFHKGITKQQGTTSNINNNSIQYFERDSNTTIPIMIHFDKELTTKLHKTQNRKGAMRTISKNLLKRVEKLFQRPSLKIKIKFKLLGARSLKRRIVNDANVSKYLRGYCRWQGERKKLQKRSYFSVLLTGLDVFYLHKGKKVLSSTGRSFKGGICSMYHSCTLLEWKGKNIVFLLAHEIAHSLGVRHDSQNPRCTDKKYIMSRQYDPHRTPEIWSLCSRWDLQNFLSKKDSWCLKSEFKINNKTSHTNNNN